MFHVRSNIDWFLDLLASAEVKFEIIAALSPHDIHTAIGWKYKRSITHAYVSDLISFKWRPNIMPPINYAWTHGIMC